jgi:hypothetical protein
MFGFFLLLALCNDTSRVLVPGGAAFSVCDANIKQALAASLPKSHDTFVSPVFVIKTRMRIVSLISTFIFPCDDFIQVSARVAVTVTELSFNFLSRLADCPTVD